MAAAAAYGMPGQTAAGTAATAATAGLTSQQQAALAAQAAQGAALAQQPSVVMQAYPSTAVQQFQVNGQPTTIAL